MCIGDSWHSASMVFLFSYAFMLRLPSEALPVCVGSKLSLEGLSAAICKEGDAIVLRLLTRKNRQEGATLKRYCWCQHCKETCPVHVLAPFLMTGGPGSVPFIDFSAKAATDDLREVLDILEIRGAQNYRPHDLRRGHARDLQSSGVSLAEFTAAGQWAPAWTRYADMDVLEDEAVAEAKVFRRFQCVAEPHAGDDRSCHDYADWLSDSGSESNPEL